MEGEHGKEEHVASGLWEWLLANNQLKDKDLSPTTKRKQIQLTTWMTLEVNSSSKPPNKNVAIWLLQWDTGQRTQLSQNSDLQNCELINRYCFKPTTFVVIRYTAIKKLIQKDWEFWQATKINVKEINRIPELKTTTEIKKKTQCIGLKADRHTEPCSVGGFQFLHILNNTAIFIVFQWWMNKLWDMHTVEYYAAIKMKEALIHATMWKNLENIMQSEISQS